jgi:hypothetical protein
MTAKPSKFKFLADQATIVTPKPEPETIPEPEAIPEPPIELTSTAPKPGRPKGAAGGKRSDPNYKQITAYISIDIHKQVKQLMFNDDDRRDFSELMQELLEDYIEARKAESK